MKFYSAVVCAGAVTLMLCPSCAPAQVSPPTPGDSDRVIPEKLKPNQSDRPAASDSLSDKLKGSNGSITPPSNVDSGMEKRPADQTTRDRNIITPAPVSPDGRETVEPN
jgi:hypothetical protein